MRATATSNAPKEPANDQLAGRLIVVDDERAGLVPELRTRRGLHDRYTLQERHTLETSKHRWRVSLHRGQRLKFLGTRIAH
jgi:hypothetical protein